MAEDATAPNESEGFPNSHTALDLTGDSPESEPRELIGDMSPGRVSPLWVSSCRLAR